mmetsp:Transcript_632/g.1061  ORF Transcript_632/g.1061 Transcript_632/m.1061 type:complete len:516 (-) Transcript_632:39-1586(-)|eukprot:CAMPEP_0201521170 /NCGR_PEP_ID=MMETSP0161_2-20130828/14258_1 /ASSEMBLY_ACC=CAM_ASM_000251 /TAXON_ID=180227 /ORGANISM="Neoparamoeba aestuarina, Strain SoJaBio B1-5/56/2" /LENGTH=515 /DNA_ID=CAMNT_0047919751 /DNA_START=49 /DNA_END=1596 /DNA_ORIENTATION=+
MADNEAPKPEWYQHNLLSDPKYGDVTFQFDKKNLVAHSSILCVRCRVLYQMYEKAQPKKKKDRKGVTHLTVPQPHADYPITAETFELILRYLYADDIQFETLSGRQALDLCIAAHEFDLPRLIRLCQDHLKKAISLDNVHSLLKVAHDTKQDKVRSMCVLFASKNRKEFIGNKAAVGEIGVELFQDVMASLMAPDEDDDQEKEPPARTIVADFKKLYTDVDVGAFPGDAVVQLKGHDIPFHKAFFAALSKSLSQSFQPCANGDENVTDIMKVKPCLSSAESFRAVLKYIYYGDISGLSVMIACEVQEFAKSHGMTELQNICEYIMAVTITTESCMSIMKVVFNPGNLKRPELRNTRKDSLTFFRENLTQISLSTGDLLENGPIVMAEIILAWQIAERAENEGVTIEDYMKKEGFDETRYTDIALAAATSLEKEDKEEDSKDHHHHKKEKDSSSAAPKSSGSTAFVTASPSHTRQKTADPKEEESDKKGEKGEKEEKGDKKGEKKKSRGFFGRGKK